MSKLIRDNYYQDGLTKYECTECGLEFIGTEAIAEMNEADGTFYDLGCMGIYYDLTQYDEDIEIEDCVKSISVDEGTGEIEIEFKDEQTPEEVDVIRKWVHEIAGKIRYDIIPE